MANENPLSWEEVLRAEREALSAGDDRDRQGSHSALCISGGGIRSATFALGAIQSLAQHGLLSRFDYLSTVSGGGYIGSWLTAWIHRAKGINKVTPQLAPFATPPAPGEPDPVQHLRAYNSYLTPRSGALSIDLWTVLATVLRNIALNWTVLLPMLMAVLMLPRLVLAALAGPEYVHGDVIFASGDPNYRAPQLNGISQSPWVQYVLPLCSLFLLATALFNTLRYLPGVGGRPHTTLAFGLAVLGPLVGAALCFLLYDSLYFLGDAYKEHTSMLLIVPWTAAACCCAWLAFVLSDRRPLSSRLRLLASPVSLAMVVMATGVGMGTWAVTDYALWNPDPSLAPSWAEYVTLGPPTILLAYCLGTWLFVGLTSAVLKDEDREWMSRAIGTVLLFSVLWAGLCTMVLVLPKWALDWQAWSHGLLATATAGSAWLSTLGGAAANRAQPDGASTGRSSQLLALVTMAAPVVFLLLLAGALSVATNGLLAALHAWAAKPLLGVSGQAIDWTNHYGMLTRANPWLLVALCGLLVFISAVTARWVNINTFSLSGMYRDRLVRAYLGASHTHRKPSPFTGFCVTDDLPMAAISPQQRPFHVVNLTLNLVGGGRLAWQQRKAESFTVTPLHCGTADDGYRPSDRYAGGITLGTAVAISGAAASPNMGYHSSALVGFIMTLFNARLGAWLGNPGEPGRHTWTRPGPSWALRSLVDEALGQTSGGSPFVNLSDGGHFENFGLYEMVRRGCRWIVVLDGGCDAEFGFEDLGNALRKIRIDLRVAIDFDEDQMQLLRQKKQRFATAAIGYAALGHGAVDGRLLYIKPMVQGNEPPDVMSYALAHPSFPHESTADQWFVESQTESYRALGQLTLDAMCRSEQPQSLPDWLNQLSGREPGHANDALQP
jgi:hypothetical protein